MQYFALLLTLVSAVVALVLLSLGLAVKLLVDAVAPGLVD